MRFLFLLTLALPAFAAKPGNFIVKLKDGASQSDVLSSIGSVSSNSASQDWKLINGFTGTFDEAAVQSLRDSPSVEHVEQDFIVEISSLSELFAPWGLQRISSGERIVDGNDTALDFVYTYEEPSGSGVDIYIVDTGINTNHTQFCNGRAKWGQTFVEGAPSVDDHGHGTHVAGIAAGTRFGVAKEANLIAVKTFNSTGQGRLGELLDGLDYVYRQSRSSKNPSVVNLSFASAGSPVLDSAVNALAHAGVHVVVAAGNQNLDAKDFSPARAEQAICVGATDINDHRAGFSNFGPDVAVFAPGTNVVSAWNTDDQAVNVRSGTSAASPHVAGIVAYLVALEGNKSPEEMKKRVRELAIEGVLKDIPEGTDNLLAQLPKVNGH